MSASYTLHNVIKLLYHIIASFYTIHNYNIFLCQVKSFAALFIIIVFYHKIKQNKIEHTNKIEN